MTVLEFIRKNSLLVLVVIFAVGVGLIMMDYSGKGSAFSNDYYIQVNGTNYDYPETAALGENASGFIQSLYTATRTKLNDRFDANKNGEMEQEELVALQNWLNQHPEPGASLMALQSAMEYWSFGAAHEPAVNMAVNRAIIKEEAKAMGIVPSKEQIDAYIRTMPAFQHADGSFDQQLYQRLTGFRNGIANNPQEQAFRDVVSDLIVWEYLQALTTSGIAYDTDTLVSIINASMQNVTGKTAWLPAGKVPAPADPTEEEIAAYWEAHKDNYKSEERRIITLYTLLPGKDTTQTDLENTADAIMHDLSMSDGKGLETILENAAQNPEYAAFTYQREDGSSHITFPLCTQAEAPAELQETVNIGGNPAPLSTVAFSEIANAPTVKAYEEAQKRQTDDKLVSIRQFRGFNYATDKVAAYLLLINAVEEPATLPYEQAREKALADLKTEKLNNALDEAAGKLYGEMTQALGAGSDLNAAFEKAVAAGADVSDFGPTQLGFLAELPEGVSTQDLLGTPTGKLCPLSVSPAGIRVTAITDRTIEQNEELFLRQIDLLPSINDQLRREIMRDWQIAAYSRMEVRLSDKVRRN